MNKRIERDDSQDRLLVLLSVVLQALTQPSGVWSFSSCTLRFFVPIQIIDLVNLSRLHRVFFFILILASLSTLIDLARDRGSPTPFGTQHFAILLVAWCPAIIFGSSAPPHFLTATGFLNLLQGVFLAFATHSCHDVVGHSALWSSIMYRFPFSSRSHNPLLAINPRES